MDQVGRPLYGCVKFDDVRHHTAGWASIAGKPSYRIAGTKDLPSNVSWLTNLDYEMSHKAGFGVHAGFRRSEYLSEYFFKVEKSVDKYSPIESPCFDFAKMLDSGSASESLITERFATVFDRVMMLSEKLLGIQGLPTYSLASGFRSKITGHDAVLPNNIVAALENATASVIKAERNTESIETDNAMTLILPRVMHGVKCASVLEPKGKWVSLSLPDNNEEAIDDWVCRYNGYFIVDMSINKMNEQAHRIINFGSGRDVRRWITGIELAVLNKIGSVTLVSAYRPTILEPLTTLSPLMEAHNDVHELSLSAGIFWQNIWMGLCAKKPPPPHILSTSKSINAIAPFIRATDRNECFLAALALQKHGISVIKYGRGQLTIQFDGDNDRLADALRATRLVPCFLKSRARNDISIDSPIRMMQEIYLQGDFERLNEADEQIMELLCQN